MIPATDEALRTSLDTQEQLILLELFPLFK